MLNEIHQALGSSVAIDELLTLILDRAFEQLQPEEGAIFLKDAQGEYRCAASRSNRGGNHRCLYSRSLIHEVGEKGLAALVLDAQMDDRFNQAMSILNAGVRSLVAAPLLDPNGALGMMVLGSTFSTRQFTEEDMELLTSLASVAAMRIRNVKLAEEAAERMRLAREVELAREIQMRLMPDSLPTLEGYQLHGGNLPSRIVSGDFFKVVERAGGSECVLFLADVSGKGMGAALLTGYLEALISGLLEQALPPDETCATASRLMFERTPPEKYATGFLAILDTATGTLRYANGGHNPALLVRGDGSTEWLESNGPPLGILPDGQYAAAETNLAPGDTIVLYTDGITEAANPQEEEYGEERLEKACVTHHGLPVDELAKALESDLEAFAKGVPYADDRTIVILRREA
jgi:serine phosphatase RsbU (regulator of sigma subunit)